MTTSVTSVLEAPTTSRLRDLAHSAGLAVGAITFHTDFDEASLGAITGLESDIPNAGIGSFTLNTATDTLDFVTGNADMWGSRANAPIAWVAAPTVANGEVWYVETKVNMENNGSNSQEVAGITFYGGPDGARPDFGFGLDDWNGWNARLQGLGDNNPNVGSSDLGSATGVFLRVEITEGGASDTYNYFWKVNQGDAWNQLGGAATDYSSSFANDRVGLFLKSSAGGGDAQYEFLTVGVIPEPSSALLAMVGGLFVLRRRR